MYVNLGREELAKHSVIYSLGISPGGKKAVQANETKEDHVIMGDVKKGGIAGKFAEGVDDKKARKEEKKAQKQKKKEEKTKKKDKDTPQEGDDNANEVADGKEPKCVI